MSKWPARHVPNFAFATLTTPNHRECVPTKRTKYVKIWSFHSLQKNTWWPSRNIQNQPSLATQLGSSNVALSATYFVRMSRKGEVSVLGSSSSCCVFLASATRMPNWMRVDHDDAKNDDHFMILMIMTADRTARSLICTLWLASLQDPAMCTCFCYQYLCSCTKKPITSSSRIQARKFNVILTCWADSDILSGISIFGTIPKETKISTVQLLSLSRLHLRVQNNENHLIWKKMKDAYPKKETSN